MGKGLSDSNYRRYTIVETFRRAGPAAFTSYQQQEKYPADVRCFTIAASAIILEAPIERGKKEFYAGFSES